MIDVKEKIFKVVLLGDSEVGKSSLLNRLFQREFNINQISTIGAAFFSYKITINSINYNFEIWDTAGQERFRSLAPMYYRGAKAALIVFDVTNNESFKNTKRWINELRKHADKNIIIVLVGNKIDLLKLDDIFYVEAETFAEKESVLFRKSSAKSGEYVDEVFTDTFKTIIESYKDQKEVENSNIISLANPSKDCLC